jgi:hypothetical protein
VGDGTGIEWTDVPGWPGAQASRCGLVRGPSGKVLKPYVADSGHLHVLIREGGRGSRARKLRVHHAVLLTYVGPRPDGHEGRHLNDDPTDNRVENLSWGTRLQNADDRRRNRGFAGTPTLTEAQVAAIRTDERAARAVAVEYGVTHTTILRIRRGESWAA